MRFGVIEFGLALLAILLAFTAPRLVNAPFARLERSARPLIERPGLMILAVMALALLLRAAVLPWLGQPVPLIHDEQSLFLQAQTFISGHLAAPAHPLWRYFETFHVNVIPTHASIYFPGRGLPLVIGMWLTGNAWAGVWLSMILMCGATVWMLLGWVRPSLALLGGLIVVFRYAVFSYWINSFWGGAFTALGAILVLGAAPRLLRDPRWLDGLLLGLGALILMTTRPYEGLFFCLPVAVVLLVHLWRLVRRAQLVPAMRFVVPSILCVAVGLVAIASYNKATTGDMLLSPYDLNRERYAYAPALLISPPTTPAIELNERFHRFYRWEADSHDRRTTADRVVRSMAGKLRTVWRFYVGPALTIPFVIGLWLLMRRRSLPLFVGGVLLVAFLIETWDFPHYVSPILAVIILMIVEGLGWLRGWRWRGRETGLALSRLLPVIGAVMLLVPFGRVAIGFPAIGSNNWNAACCAFETESPRSRAEAYLNQTEGRDLVIVRPRVGEWVHEEWVYNEPWPDKADIVWAHDLGPEETAKLRAYYKDRRHWLVEGIRPPEGGRLRELPPLDP